MTDTPRGVDHRRRSSSPALARGSNRVWDQLMARRSAALRRQDLRALHRPSARSRSISTSRFRRRAISGRWRPGSASASTRRALRSAMPASPASAELLDHTDMIVAAGGGERDIAVDTAILTGMRKAAEPRRVPQRTADERPAPHAVPGAAAEPARRQHLAGARRGRLLAHLHGRGSSRRRRACASRMRASPPVRAKSRLVGGAYHGTRWDVLLSFELGDAAAQGQVRAGLGSRSAGRHRVRRPWAPSSCSKAASMRRRAAPSPMRRSSQVYSDRNLRAPGDTEATLRRQWAAIAASVERAHAAVISGASGLEPATSGGAAACSRRFGLPVRNTGTYIGHGVEAQFLGQYRHRLRGARSTARCSPRPEAAIPATAPPAAVARSWSPASAIGAAKASRWSNAVD